MFRNKLFVSYSHEDMRWLHRVREQLDVLEREKLLESFDDTRIVAGADWYARLSTEMREARVALLLISPSFLTSSFIRTKEIPLLFARHEQEGLVIYPLLVRDCAWQEVGWLARMQIRPADARPIASMRGSNLDSCLASVAREITAIMREWSTPCAESDTTTLAASDRTEPLFEDWEAIGKELISFPFDTMGGTKQSTPISDFAAVKHAAEQWANVDWARAAREYRARLLDQVSTTRLLGHPRLIAVDKTYVDVLAFDQANAYRRSVDFEDHLLSSPYAFEDAKIRRPAEELVRTGSNLYILGRPGAGKTTFLKHLTMLACSGHLRQTPIFVALREYAQSGESLIDFVVSQFSSCRFPSPKHFVERLLCSGRVLILFDGLDEVNEADAVRSTLIAHLTRFSSEFSKCQLCVTCRIAATEYSFQQFQYLEIADFTKAQQREFIARWYEDQPNEASTILAEWENESSKPLQDLARTPLLLALICLAFDDMQHLPRRIVDLYIDAFDVLLKKWDRSRNVIRDTIYKDLTPSRKTHLLEDLAARNFSHNCTVFRSGPLLTQIASWYQTLPGAKELDPDAAEAILNAMEAQHGLLVQRARDIYSFSHLSFQEFFTAQAMVHGHSAFSMEELMQKHLVDERWREVFLFGAGLFPDASSFLTRMRVQVWRILGEAEGALEFMRFVCINTYATKTAATNYRHTGRGRTSRSIPPDELQKIQEHLHAMIQVVEEMSIQTDLVVKRLQFASVCLSFEPRLVCKENGTATYRFRDYLYSLRLLFECVSAAAIPDRRFFVDSMFTDVH